MTFRPMLAFSKLPDFNRLRFPLYVSPKLDGIRASMQDGHLVSRSLKPIPNKAVQDMFRNLPDGIDGELIQGDPGTEPFRRTTSIVMSSDKPANGVKLYVFDRFFASPNATFNTRFPGIRSLGLESLFEVVIVPHFPVNSVEELEVHEQNFLKHGFEGLMIRSTDGPYKQGRSTEAEGWLMKVKRFEDGEARIDDCYEEMENQNVTFTNELGRTARSTHQAGMVGKNRLGGFHVTGVGGRYDGVKFDIASGAMPHEMREKLWTTPVPSILHPLVGKLVVYKYFPTGGDTKPRHPIWKGFRSLEDL